HTRDFHSFPTRRSSDLDRDVVMPARKEASLEMVEAQLSFQVLVHALGAPAFLDEADELLLAQGVRQGGEVEMGGLNLVVAPFGRSEEHTSELQSLRHLV